MSGLFCTFAMFCVMFENFSEVTPQQVKTRVEPPCGHTTLQCLPLSHLLPPVIRWQINWFHYRKHVTTRTVIPVLQWKSHAGWIDTNLLWWLSGSGAVLHLHWWQLWRSTNLFSDDIRWLKAWADPVIIGESQISVPPLATMTSVRFARSLPRSGATDDKMIGTRLDGRLDSGHLGDQQKRGPGQCQSPSLLKPNAWQWTLNWWQDQSIHMCHITLSTIKWFSGGHTADWTRTRFVRTRLCEGLRVQRLACRWPWSSLCSHSGGTCRQRHLLAASKDRDRDLSLGSGHDSGHKRHRRWFILLFVCPWSSSIDHG